MNTPKTPAQVAEWAIITRAVQEVVMPAYKEEIAADKAQSDALKAAVDAARAESDALLEKGESKPIRITLDGEDVKLGRISKTDPKPVPVIHDPAMLEDYLRSEHPDELEQFIHPDDLAEIIPILVQAGRSDLISERVPEWMKMDAKARASKAGVAIPGIKRESPDGVLSVSVEPILKDRLAEILRASEMPALHFGDDFIAAASESQSRALERVLELPVGGQ